MTRATLRVSVLVASLALLGACDAISLPADTTRVVEWPAGLAAEPLPSPTPGTSRAPSLSARNGRVLVSWLEFADFQATLRFAHRTTEGWSLPRTVVGGDDLLDNTADIPSVRELRDGALLAQWPHGNYDDPEAYDLSVAWSEDGGQTWSRPIQPHHDGVVAQHGFASLFDLPGPQFGVVWLDGRRQPTRGVIGLWSARFTRDGRQQDEVEVEPRVCECCQTSVASDRDGVVIAYRGRTEGEVRDIHVARYDGRQWGRGRIVHADGWTINGCPVNGPAVAKRQEAVVVAWFTVRDDAGRTLVAHSIDGGHSFGSPVIVDDGRSRGLVDVVLLDDGTAAVSWVEVTDTGSELRVRRVGSGGARSAALTVATVVGRHYPRMVHGVNELVFAWTELDRGYTFVRTSRLPLAGLR